MVRHPPKKYSKTDPLGQGVIVKLFPLPSTLCPVAAVEAYLSQRKSIDSNPESPFFMMPSKLPLTRSDFSANLGLLLMSVQGQKGYIRPHSFRIGAATAAAKAGVPDHVIKVLGRWSSDSYQRYIRTSECVLASAQMAISGAGGH